LKAFAMTGVLRRLTDDRRRAISKRETERKYEAPSADDTSWLPDLTSVDDIASVAGKGLDELDVEYYDTDGLRLVGPSAGGGPLPVGGAGSPTSRDSRNYLTERKRLIVIAVAVERWAVSPVHPRQRAALLACGLLGTSWTATPGRGPPTYGGALLHQRPVACEGTGERNRCSGQEAQNLPGCRFVEPLGLFSQ
jgi:hypothetical protein